MTVDPESRRPSSTAERIVEAAMALLDERGLHGVSISAIAQRAGVTRQTVYNHFPSVDHIVLTVREQHAAGPTRHAEELVRTASTADEKLEVFIRHAIAGHTADTEHFEGALGPDARDRLADHDRVVNRLVVEILESGMADGSLRDDLRPEIDAPLVRGTVTAAARLVMERGGDPAVVADATIRSVRASLERR